MNQPLILRHFDPRDFRHEPGAMCSVAVDKMDPTKRFGEHPIPVRAPAAVFDPLGARKDGGEVLRIEREVDGHFLLFPLSPPSGVGYLFCLGLPPFRPFSRLEAALRSDFALPIAAAACLMGVSW